jgi:hypothetical protein
MKDSTLSHLHEVVLSSFGSPLPAIVVPLLDAESARREPSRSSWFDATKDIGPFVGCLPPAPSDLIFSEGVPSSESQLHCAIDGHPNAKGQRRCRDRRRPTRCRWRQRRPLTCDWCSQENDRFSGLQKNYNDPFSAARQVSAAQLFSASSRAASASGGEAGS